MVISQIIGGLGNQMFQYAAGRALALSRNVPLRLDISSFKEYRLHNGFEIPQIFSGEFEIATGCDLQKVLGWRSGRFARRVLRRSQMAFIRGNQFVVEPYYHFWDGFFDLSGDCYLEGYWQSAKYFSPIAEAIRSDFTFRLPLSGANRELAGQMTQNGAVSLHIRRGDYVSDVKTRTVLNLCPLEYYQRAVRFIAERVDRPHFFIFSDDPAWVKSNLKLEFPCSYIDHNRGAESYNDMHLMSLCRHHIIANSSFSWWGAWLDPRPDKIVVAPERWFANGNSTSDLLPREWFQV